MNKIAKLIWFEFGVRVVVDENATEEQIYEAAMDKVVREPRGYICFDNVTEIFDDTECPYDPETDFNYTEAEHLLQQHLRACHLLTSEMKVRDEDPDWDCIGGMQLCYDERNEEIRTGDCQFWLELPLEVKQYVLRKFME